MDTGISCSIPIFTIGYGNRKFDDFVELLKKYQISYLIDIRSFPYSKYNPDFTKNALSIHLTKHNIHYVYMGDALGGRPNLPSCYTDGKVDYQKLREQEFYKAGIKRLQKAWNQKLRVALLCSEAKPEECHRSKLVGESLIENGIDVVHIDEKGDLKIHSKVISGLTHEQLTLSRKKYQQKDSPDNAEQADRY